MNAKRRNLLLASALLVWPSFARAQSESGVWNPVVTCDVPGDLVITFSTDPLINNGVRGDWWRSGRLVVVTYRINFGISYGSSAGGRVKVTGLPFPSQTALNSQTTGTLTYQCVNAIHQATGKRYTQFGSLLFPGEQALKYFAAGEGVPEAGLYINNLSNNQPWVLLEGTHLYFTDA
jgi:hypothetical protein